MISAGNTSLTGNRFVFGENIVARQQQELDWLEDTLLQNSGIFVIKFRLRPKGGKGSCFPATQEIFKSTMMRAGDWYLKVREVFHRIESARTVDIWNEIIGHLEGYLRARAHVQHCNRTPKIRYIFSRIFTQRRSCFGPLNNGANIVAETLTHVQFSVTEALFSNHWDQTSRRDMCSEQGLTHFPLNLTQSEEVHLHFRFDRRLKVNRTNINLLAGKRGKQRTQSLDLNYMYLIPRPAQTHNVSPVCQNTEYFTKRGSIAPTSQVAPCWKSFQTKNPRLSFFYGALVSLPATVGLSLDMIEQGRSPKATPTGVPWLMLYHTLCRVPAWQPGSNTSGSKCTGKSASDNLKWNTELWSWWHYLLVKDPLALASAPGDRKVAKGQCLLHCRQTMPTCIPVVHLGSFQLQLTTKRTFAGKNTNDSFASAFWWQMFTPRF